MPTGGAWPERAQGVNISPKRRSGGEFPQEPRYENALHSPYPPGFLPGRLGGETPLPAPPGKQAKLELTGHKLTPEEADMANLKDSALDQLKAGLRGELLRPDEEGYDAARR